jgi:hypothetical protein
MLKLTVPYSAKLANLDLAGSVSLCQKHINSICEEIQKKAIAGGNSLKYYFNDNAIAPHLLLSDPDEVSFGLSKIVDALRSANYKVSVLEHTYIPKGLQDDYGSGPEYGQNFLLIEWQ